MLHCIGALQRKLNSSSTVLKLCHTPSTCPAWESSGDNTHTPRTHARVSEHLLLKERSRHKGDDIVLGSLDVIVTKSGNFGIVELNHTIFIYGTLITKTTTATPRRRCCTHVRRTQGFGIVHFEEIVPSATQVNPNYTLCDKSNLRDTSGASARD